MNRTLCVRVQASKPVVMVNSCTGKMGKAVADAAVRAGLTLAPYTLCSEGEAGQTIEVAGHQLQLIGPSTRDKVIEQVGQVPPAAPLPEAAHPAPSTLRQQLHD
jgi:4-hydroxy-tetrahydrodipicolinate reductase